MRDGSLLLYHPTPGEPGYEKLLDGVQEKVRIPVILRFTIFGETHERTTS